MSGDGSESGEGGGLLSRLRTWLGGLFGGRSASDAEAGAEAGVCAVCGTRVEDPSAGCPLCGSTDVAPAGDAPADDGGTPEPERRSVGGTPDDDAARLRDVRGAGPDAPGGGTDGGPDGAAGGGTGDDGSGGDSDGA